VLVSRSLIRGMIRAMSRVVKAVVRAVEIAAVEIVDVVAGVAGMSVVVVAGMAIAMRHLVRSSVQRHRGWIRQRLCFLR
jgi:hypothetical protein